MVDITTPAQVVGELNRLMQLQQKGIDALYAAEERLARLESDLDLVEAKAFLDVPGTVADRERLARLKSADERLARDIGRAEVGRVKQKLRAIEQAFMATSVIAKQIELEWKR